jgi:hypothetical protein
MAHLSGEKGRAFVEWLEEAKFILPPMTKISEARLIWERKVAEEEALKNEQAK